MSLKINSGRQWPHVARIAFVAADVAAGFNPAIEVPANAVVTRGALDVLVVDSGAATVNVGDTTTANRYGAALVTNALGREALTATGYKYPAASKVGVTFSDLPVTGSFVLEVEYVVEGHVDTTQGLDFRAVGIPGA